MKVFILFFDNEIMDQIIGVYDTVEKANSAREDLENFMKNISSAVRCYANIIEMNVE